MIIHKLLHPDIFDTWVFFPLYIGTMIGKFIIAVDRLKKNLEVFYELGNAEVPLEIKKIQAKYLLEVYNTYFAF